MATSLLQVRVEDSLKDEAAQVFEKLGIDASTAVRMFLKRVIMENGIPFRMTLPKTPYNADRGYRAMVEISDASEKNGVLICRWMKSMPRLRHPGKSGR